jgi:DNA-binding response OmpR family regulator
VKELLPVVLVVEDEHAVQGFIADALNEAGFGAVSLSSGEEALTILSGVNADRKRTPIGAVRTPSGH